jgi:hypothetical protein
MELQQWQRVDFLFWLAGDSFFLLRPVCDDKIYSRLFKKKKDNTARFI